MSGFPFHSQILVLVERLSDGPAITQNLGRTNRHVESQTSFANTGAAEKLDLHPLYRWKVLLAEAMYLCH